MKQASPVARWLQRKQLCCTGWQVLSGCYSHKAGFDIESDNVRLLLQLSCHFAQKCQPYSISCSTADLGCVPIGLCIGGPYLTAKKPSWSACLNSSRPLTWAPPSLTV